MRVAHALVPVLVIFDWAPLLLLLSLDQSESESPESSGAALGGARFLPSAFEERHVNNLKNL